MSQHWSDNHGKKLKNWQLKEHTTGATFEVKNYEKEIKNIQNKGDLPTMVER